MPKIYEFCINHSKYDFLLHQKKNYYERTTRIRKSKIHKYYLWRRMKRVVHYLLYLLKVCLHQLTFVCVFCSPWKQEKTSLAPLRVNFMALIRFCHTPNTVGFKSTELLYALCCVYLLTSFYLIFDCFFLSLSLAHSLAWVHNLIWQQSSCNFFLCVIFFSISLL